MKILPKKGPGQRLLGCPYYKSCLDFAASQGWSIFNCESCEYYIETLHQGPDQGDRARTEEIKRYSREPQSGPSGERDRRNAVMNLASAEIERRTKEAMLHSNLDYSEVSKRIFQADPVLAELYAKGYSLEK